MVLPRVLTAVLLVPLTVAVVWLGSIPFFIFAFGVCLISLWEYSLIAEEGGYPNHLILSLLGGALVVLSLYIDGAPLGPLRKAPGPLSILMFWTLILFLREFIRKDKSLSFLRIITTLGGIILCAFFMGHMILIRDLKMVTGEGYQLIGRNLMFFLLITIWIVDTGAWFVGRMMGRFHMAPRISPKKTWEGAIGGTLLACAAGWFFREAFLRTSFGRNEAIFYAFFIAVTAQISDLAESLIKRSFGVKDSSQLLPGHGGVLDRFDSFLFAAPFFYYLLIGTGRFQ